MTPLIERRLVDDIRFIPRSGLSLLF